MRIGIDLMGGETPPEKLLPAVLEVADASGGAVVFTLFTLGTTCAPHPCIDICPCEEVVTMDDPPLLAVRRKKGSTLATGMRYLAEGTIDAFISAGNTGALVAQAILTLGRLPKIERPALLALLPHEKGKVAVLDVGANIALRPQDLLDYARMGMLYQHHMQSIAHPTVGLLNIGAEEEKGTHTIKEGYRLLQEHLKGSFLGNIEGREVFLGKVDVLVTDGFTGNIFLKTCEGISSFLLDRLNEWGSGSPLLSRFSAFSTHSQEAGALLAGVNGLVIKCHGNSDASALKRAIHATERLSSRALLSTLKSCLG